MCAAMRPLVRQQYTEKLVLCAFTCRRALRKRMERVRYRWFGDAALHSSLHGLTKLYFFLLPAALAVAHCNAGLRAEHTHFATAEPPPHQAASAGHEKSLSHAILFAPLTKYYCTYVPVRTSREYKRRTHAHSREQQTGSWTARRRCFSAADACM